jgi:hypothetical protein
MPRRLEPSHDLLSSSGMPMRCLSAIVQPLVGAMIGTRAITPQGDGVALQRVGHRDARGALLPHQRVQKALGRCGIPALLH